MLFGSFGFLIPIFIVISVITLFENCSVSFDRLAIATIHESQNIYLCDFVFQELYLERIQ